MAEIDHGVKLLAHAAGRQLARLARLSCQEWEPLESTVQATTERLADRVFRARRGRQRFVVYMEFYAFWNRDVPWDMQVKAAMLSRRERLPTVTLVFILRPRGYRPQHGQFRLAVGAEPTQQLWFHEAPLWEQTPEPWWEETPELMTLYPLCRHGQRPREAVRHAAQIIDQRITDSIKRADNLCILGVFSELAFPRLDVRTIIGREKMWKSRLFREFREEGREEGEQKARREATLEALQERFGESSVAPLAADVNAIEDLTELRRLFKLALRCAQLDEFRSALLHPETHP